MDPATFRIFGTRDIDIYSKMYVYLVQLGLDMEGIIHCLFDTIFYMLIFYIAIYSNLSLV